MPYDLPFLTRSRRRFKRDADRTRTEEISREQAFRDFVSRNPEPFQTETQLASSQELERLTALRRSPEQIAELTKPSFGIIPGGSGLGDFLETLNLPFTALGGSLVESFTQKPEFNLGGFGQPDLGFRGTIERQQQRGPVTRGLSEAVSPIEAVGLVKGAVGLGKLGIGLARPTRALAAPRFEPPLPTGTRTERLKVLEEFGLIPDSSINQFAHQLRDWDSVISDVHTTDNPIVKSVVSRTGINPSVARSTDVGRAVTAYQTQLVAIDNLLDVAVSSAFDVHAQRFTGRLGHILPIDKDGFFGDTGVLWQKVFENPSLYPKISKATRSLIDDFNEVTNHEIPRLLDDAGIDLKMRSRPQGEYYVPRDVEAIRGIELTRHSNPELQRHYDDIMEGISQGIDYSKDPRNSLLIHLRWAYRKIAKKQLDDALEPLSLSPKEILKVKDPDVISRYEQAIKSRHDLEIGLRKIKRGLRTVNIHLRLGGERVSGREKLLSITDDDLESLDQYIKSLDVLPYTKEPKVPLQGPEARALKRLVKAREARKSYKKLSARAETQSASLRRANRIKAELEGQEAFLKSIKENVDLQLPGARTEHMSAKNAYSRGIDEYRKSQETTAFWGPNQPNEILMENWRSRFFPAEDAELLKSQLERSGVQTLSDKAFRALEIAGNTQRFLSSVGDFAMPFIQGQTVFAANPVSWSRMTLRHYQAFFDPTVQARLIKENIDDFAWLAQHGVPVGDPEFFAALKPGQSISFDWLFNSVPKGDEARRLARLGGQQTFGRFQASYNTGLGWSRALLYKGMKDSFRGTEAELAQYLRNMTGGLDARALGVGPSQRSVEGIFLAFSPRLLRSTTALAWDAFANLASPQGQAALRSIATLLTGATGIYVTTGLALHKSWEEIQTGLHPLSGKRFMSHQINGDWIGIGGQVRALTQLMTALTIGAAGSPKSLVSTSLFENPFIRFLAGRGAPGSEIIGSVVEGISQGDINALPYDVVDGPLDLVKHLVTNMAPFAVQGILEGEQLGTSLSSLVGARTSAETIFEKRNLARQQEMDRLQITGEYKDLDPDVRHKVSQSQSVKLAESQVADQLRKEQSKVQAFKDKLTSIDERTSTLIRQAEEELGQGKKLREAYSTHERDRARDKQLIVGENQDIIKVWDELFPAESDFELAFEDYTSAIYDKRLENEATLSYDFALREKLLLDVRAKHGDDMIERVESFIQRRETPLQRKLREDRATLRPYWDVGQAILDLDLPAEIKSIWAEYLTSGSNQQYSLELQNPWILKLNSAVADVKEQIRATNPDIDSALVRWEYGPRPRTLSGIESFLESIQPRIPAGVP